MALLDHPQLAPLKSRYDALELREQQAVKALAVFFTALFLYFGLVAPANEFHADRLSDYERYQSLLEYMRSTEAQARAAKGGAPVAANGQNLMSSVSNSTRRFGIKPRILQPEGDNGVSVWFDAVSFALLLDWMTSVSQQGVTIRQISIDRDEATGTVTARIILRG